jgi:addiction module RelE/StbE family toxin
MNILSSSYFQKKYKKIVKKDPHLIELIEKKFILLQSAPTHPSLRLHKLTGKLTDSWSISIRTNLRIIFQYVENDILLTNIGSHDEVY